MSGHSKWASIKHKKGKTDAKRGQLFTRLIKEITIAAKAGGGDVDGNARLRAAVLTARSQNMPNDNIDKAIKRGTGQLEGVNYEEVTYEGYGPGGVAIICETQTDNRNRTVSEVRRMFEKSGGNMATQGAVSWNFDMMGVIEVEGADEDALFEAALDAGANDVSNEESFFEITTAPSDVMPVADKLRAAGFTVTSAKVARIPRTFVKLTGKEAEQMLRLMETLEDGEDTKAVWANFDIDEKELERIEELL